MEFKHVTHQLDTAQQFICVTHHLHTVQQSICVTHQLDTAQHSEHVGLVFLAWLGMHKASTHRKTYQITTTQCK